MSSNQRPSDDDLDDDDDDGDDDDGNQDDYHDHDLNDEDDDGDDDGNDFANKFHMLGDIQSSFDFMFVGRPCLGQLYNHFVKICTASIFEESL